MSDNIFDYVNLNFFSPLNVKDRRANFDMLWLLNNEMKASLEQFSRNQVVDILVDYLDQHPMEYHDDLSEETESENSRDIANKKIRYFMAAGWLVRDRGNDFVDTFQMNAAAIYILDAFEKIISDQVEPVEFSGYVYNIYTLLQHFEFSHATETVEQLHHSTLQLVSNLRSLSTNIRRYLSDLLNDSEKQPAEILDTLLYEYQDNVILKSFNNLRLRDNPARYRNGILSRIDELMDPVNMELMCDNYSKVKGGDYEQAEAFFLKNLNYVRDQFTDIEESLSYLNRQNTKYTTAAKARLTFLLNEDENVEGRINELLKNIADTGDDLESFETQLYTAGKIDEESLFVPRKLPQKVKSTVTVSEEDSEPVDPHFAEMILKSSQFSVSSINAWVMALLGSRKSVLASELEVGSEEDVIRLFLAEIYSQSDLSEYRIVYLDNEVHWFKNVLEDFRIERRKTV